MSLNTLNEGNQCNTEDVDPNDKELIDLINENRKLKYRIGIIKKVSIYRLIIYIELYWFK